MAHNITMVPSFFKVLVATDFSTQLLIPIIFVKTFSNLMMSNQYYLHTHSPDHFWKVEVENANDRVYFRKGWEKFVKDNLLKFEDFIVFKYVGHSSFRVEMYGSHACAKKVENFVSDHSHDVEAKEEKRLITNKKEKGKRIVEEEDDDDVEDIIKNMKQKSGSSKDQIPRERREVTYIEVDPPRENENDDSKEGAKRSTAFALEEARRFKSNHPFFQVHLPSSYVNSSMYLPTKFYMKYLEKAETMKLEVSGRFWSVGLIRIKTNPKSKSKYAKLSKGWKAFFDDNKLKPGDVCIFEMKEKKNFLFQVHIYTC